MRIYPINLSLALKEPDRRLGFDVWRNHTFRSTLASISSAPRGVIFRECEIRYGNVRVRKKRECEAAVNIALKQWRALIYSTLYLTKG